MAPQLRGFNPSGTGQYTTTTSGTAGVSGVPNDSLSFSGPFFVKEQSLIVDYVRVPKGVCHYASATLAGDASYQTDVKSTFLLLKVSPTVSLRKEYKNYQTSSWQQPQIFSVLALSADGYGNTYGELTAGLGGLALGPQGTIITTQKGYTRIPWDGSIHGASNLGTSSFEGFNYVAACSGECALNRYVNALNLWPTFDDWFKPTGLGQTRGWWEPIGLCGEQDYLILGDYETSKEDSSRINILLDTIGASVQNSITGNAETIPLFNWLPNGYVVQKPNADIGKLNTDEHASGPDILSIVAYDPQLHKY